tara:strand:+ start:1292 stop:1978 length:687 start_codon:yes stop_codon:yes gene_type:complete
MTSATATADDSFINFALGHFNLAVEIVLIKDFSDVAKFDTRAEADAFIAANGYVKMGEKRANEGLPCTMYGEYVPANDVDVMYFHVKHADEKKNLTVNDKVHALLEKKGYPIRSSSEAKFTKALERLVADWKAESLASCTNPRYADFVDTKVVNEIHTNRQTICGPGLTFDGSGYDMLSCEGEFPIQSYRKALKALCDIHGWVFEDCTSWAICFDSLDESISDYDPSN